MKKKTIIIISIVAVMVIALIACLIIPNVSKRNAGNSTSKDGSSVIGGDQEAGNAGKDNSSGGDSSGGGGYNNASGNSNDNGSQSGGQIQTPDAGIADIPTISFPYAIPGTELVVEQVSPYDGYYIEDGSDTDISGVAAVVLTNNGSEDLEFAGIGISQGSRNLAFSASQIPAGSTVIILEQSGAAFTADPYYSATATIRSAETFEMSEDLVSVKDNGDGSLLVSNISGKELSKVEIFFKNYLPDEDVYVGGITYTITLTDLEPGASMGVSASHYDSQYSVVVEVRAE